MTSKEVLVLRLLTEQARGMYGSQIVANSKGKLGRGTIYTLLQRMVAKGLVREVEDPPTAELQLARTRHIITAQGQRALRDFAEMLGFEMKPGTFGRG